MEKEEVCYYSRGRSEGRLLRSKTRNAAANSNRSLKGGRKAGRLH